MNARQTQNPVCFCETVAGVFSGIMHTAVVADASSVPVIGAHWLGTCYDEDSDGESRETLR